MSNVIQLPVIAGVEITTDAEGRFNLNALHRASGGKDSKRPKAWLANNQTQELVSELRQDLALGYELIKVTKGGVSPGTFVHEELAIEYAGWISPRFRILVNRTFSDYKSGKLKVAAELPDFTDPGEAAIAWAKEFKAKQAAQLECKEAIRTKAEIGGRREATAMARASAETRRANKLQEQLGISTDWKSAKSIPWLKDLFDLSIRAAYSQIGKTLTAISTDLGVKPKEIEDPNYGKVKSYHFSVVQEFQRRLNADPSLLSKYRKHGVAA